MHALVAPTPAETDGLVFVFPGQSSAGAGAVSRAWRAHPAAAELYTRAERVLGPLRAARYLHDGGAAPSTNRDVQVSVFLATQLYLAGLAAEGVDASHSLGLSLGEYSHLVHVGALDFEDALALVDERGRLFDAAPAGMMVSILAIDAETVREVVERATAHGPVVVSNYNAPTQHVISGCTAAVEWGAAELENEHGAMTVVIERSVPMHSPLMAPVVAAFRPVLERSRWQPIVRPYRPNVTADVLETPMPSDLAGLLARHVAEPVRWHESMQRALEGLAAPRIVEVGPGSVLYNLSARSWKSIPRHRTDALDGADPRAHFESLVRELRDGRG
jgi:[acyl-carrier-protein] S-malonyltransferase